MFDISCKTIKTAKPKKDWIERNVLFCVKKNVLVAKDSTGNTKNKIQDIVIAECFIQVLYKSTIWENGIEYQNRPRLHIKVLETFLEAKNINFNQNTEIFFKVEFNGSLGTVETTQGKFQFHRIEGKYIEWSAPIKNKT